MNPTLTLSPRSRSRTNAPAAVAIIYPKVGTVLRVPLRRTPTGGSYGHEQHPERQLITWFNRMAGARPGFPLQVRRILLVTGEPLCQSCYLGLARYLSRFHLADKLQLRTLAEAAPSARSATPETCSCGCGHCGHDIDYKDNSSSNSHLLNALLQDDYISDMELEDEGWWSRLKQLGQAAALTGALALGPQGAFKPVYDVAKAVAGAYEKHNKMQRTVESAQLPSRRPPGQQELGFEQEMGYEFADVAPGCASPGSGRPTLRLGARGEYVRYLQCRLNFHKVSLPQPLVNDGVWGPKTQTAVRNFQQGRGLVVDAVVGPLTWGQLDAGGAVVPTVPPKTQPVGTTPSGGTDVSTVRFRNAADINNFFLARTGQDFVDWFRGKVGGRGAWVRTHGGKTYPVTMPATADAKAGFLQFWDGIPRVFNSPDINFAQFAALQSVIVNETGGTMRPIAEKVGLPDHPGLAYAFNRIPGLKVSYNTGSNKRALELFNNREFLEAHGQKPLGAQLANTKDARWGGEAYPTDAASTSTDPAIAGFVQEADFYKFRGRGYIQITWRNAYQWLIPSVQNYSGSDPIILQKKAQWRGLSLDSVATRSSNADWQALFMQSTEFALGALKIFFGKKTNSINKVRVGDWESVRMVACDVMCTKSYTALFVQRVQQIFATLGAAPVPVGPVPQPGNVGPVPVPPAGGSEAALREAIVANALGMMAEPKIEAKLRGADGFRKGWQKLKILFETAAPDYVQSGWEENNLKRSTSVSNTAGIPHWCGIFALWAHRAAGLNVGTWKIGKGISANPAFRSIPAARVKKGDIGYYNLDPATKQPFRHHFLVREVYPDGTMDTIDGNSGGTSTVRSKSRVPLRGVDLFFSAFNG
ncbi:peptidoglycan-binding protein [Hymenobacter sp. 5317J-9]|uniref:peptidoglycan-binding domain-containing protein n=1 Tax=Hymenobacter sp. 5317J-9 TaxID=2932250 RepID=UPI001FD65234|nr:peptidoglycan-binding protein [Hymenobacter sp. 5317J-9]UOQ96259.1 peptidoglycan-binding protein [Hymenobacter sp. 5317J-9]